MNTRYCPACAARNEYTVTKPVTCSDCGCNLDKAFASAAIVVSTPVAAPARRLVQTAAPIAPRRRRPATEDQEYDPDDNYDQDEVEILASEMAQEVAGAELFSVNIDPDARPLKLGSLTNVREAATKRSQEPASPKRRARK